MTPRLKLWPQTHSRLLSALRQRVKKRRFHHILGVLQTSLSLAESHGVAVEMAAWAALLHDYCKFGRRGERANAGEDYGEPIPPEDLDYPGMWHAWAAAGEARHRFELTDAELLDAIRYHSTGHPEMGALGKILLIADALEPTRNRPDGPALLDLARRDLDAAALEVLRRKVESMRGRDQRVHPRALETLAALERAAQEEEPSTQRAKSASSPESPTT